MEHSSGALRTLARLIEMYTVDDQRVVRRPVDDEKSYRRCRDTVASFSKMSVTRLTPVEHEESSATVGRLTNWVHSAVCFVDAILTGLNVLAYADVIGSALAGVALTILAVEQKIADVKAGAANANTSLVAVMRNPVDTLHLTRFVDEMLAVGHHQHNADSMDADSHIPVRLQFV